MSSVSKLLNGLENKYKIYSVLTPLVMIGEVVMETIIPLIMAKIIDVGINTRDLDFVITYGLLMILMSVLFLTLFSQCCYPCLSSL